LHLPFPLDEIKHEFFEKPTLLLVVFIINVTVNCVVFEKTAFVCIVSGVTMGWLLRRVTGGPSGKGALTVPEFLMINFLIFVFDVTE